MVKVIRLDKRNYGGDKYNNLFKINNALAVAKNMVAFDCIPKRRELRSQLISKYNSKINAPFPISHKDIKRLEKPCKCEIPVNIVDILEIIVLEIKESRNTFNYRSTQNDIISYHILANTINALNDFMAWLNAHEENIRPENDKYRNEVAYIVESLQAFNTKHPEIFNALFVN